jgi:hypothetical protein
LGGIEIILPAPVYPKVFDVICFEFWINLKTSLINNNLIKDSNNNNNFNLNVQPGVSNRFNLKILFRESNFAAFSTNFVVGTWAHISAQYNSLSGEYRGSL